MPAGSTASDADSDAGGVALSGPPAWLTRTRVYRRVPAAVRARLDERLLARAMDRAAAARIAARYKLAERYRVSPSALLSYARKLEACVRPIVTSHLIGSVLGCLPADYRQRLVDGSQVMLLSRVIQALNHCPSPVGGRGASQHPPAALSVADLARLATIVRSVAGRGGRDRNARPRTGTQGAEAASGALAARGRMQPSHLAQTVSLIYGLDPPPEQRDPAARNDVATGGRRSGRCDEVSTGPPRGGEDAATIADA